MYSVFLFVKVIVAASWHNVLMAIAQPRILDIQGHRGARGLLPENTLPAFACALSIGVTTLELDCAITRDGVVVVSHDSTLNPDITRNADGHWITRADLAISQFTFDELQHFDVGRINPASEYAARFAHQQANDGSRMPKLDDVFALARRAGNDAVLFNIETKISPLHPERTAAPDVFAAMLIKVIQNKGLEHRAVVQSFDWRTLAVVQQEAPEIATAYLSAQQPFMDNILAHENASPWNGGRHVSQFGGSVPRMIKAAGGTIWSPCSNDVDAANVAEAQALGLKVVVWTVNTETDMQRMIALGVDGIISDYPDVLRRVAAENGFPLPAPTPVA
ncbi:MAG TPA: glycerophosphodiester phosphodiesterase [Burkholderiales bacterium]|nr:glycerophosphodiester phosphodiesterase [Burkholderiales bacterium]